MRTRKYPLEELARRGQERFQVIQPLLGDENPHHFLAIDVETGEYATHPRNLTAADQLIARNADAQIWVQRVDGSPAYRFGGRRLVNQQ